MYFNGSPYIDVFGVPGVYILDNESATGKTYLAKQLRDRDHAFTYSYGDPLPVIPADTRVIIFDRADWYRDEVWFLDLLRNYAGNTIILVALKDLESFQINTRFASIQYSHEGIDIYCDINI